jgi:DNA-binding CsgD family transcriptional regulator
MQGMPPSPANRHNRSMQGDDRIRDEDLDALTGAERTVLGLARKGRSAREIATDLVVTEATVRSHLSRIYAKLGVRGQLELMARLGSAASEPVENDATVDATRNSADTSRRRRRRLALAGTIAVVALAAAAIAIVSLREPPPEISYSQLLEAVERGDVVSIEQVGLELTIMTDGGLMFRSEMPTVLADPYVDLIELAAASGVDVPEYSASDPPDSASIGLLAMILLSLVVNVGLLALAAFVVIRIWRRFASAS